MICGYFFLVFFMGALYSFAVQKSSRIASGSFLWCTSRVKHHRRKKNASLCIRVTAEQLARWRRAAKADKRPLSHWIAVVCDDGADAILGEE